MFNEQWRCEDGPFISAEALLTSQALSPASDTTARMGGDEFALILTNMAREGLEDWIKTLLDDYDRSELYNHRNRPITCRLSVGIAAIDAETHATPQDAFDAADRVMYEVKQRHERRTSHYAIADSPPSADVTGAAQPP